MTCLALGMPLPNTVSDHHGVTIDHLVTGTHHISKGSQHKHVMVM